jgi:hypothetical protein
MSDTKAEQTNVPVQLNHTLPSIFADGLVITPRKDDLAFIRVFAYLPEGMIEQARITMTASRLKSALDVICEQLEYYPVKPSATGPSKK